MNNALAILRSALVAFYRTSARHPLYTALNVLGLAFGIAVFIAISLFVRYELTFDRWLPNAGRIHEISFERLDTDEPYRNYSSHGGALDAVRTVVPEIKGVRLVVNYVFLSRGNESFDEREYLVDPEVFDVFDLPMVAGERRLPADGVLISESIARRYFGGTDVVGRSLVVRDQGSQLYPPPPDLILPRAYRVVGVLRDSPPNSSIRFDIVRLLTPQRIAMFGDHWQDWHWTAHRTFVRIDTPEQVKRLNAAFDNLVDTFGTRSYFSALYSGRLTHEIMRTRAISWPEEHWASRSVHVAAMLGVVACLTLAVALVNYVNLAMVRMAGRAREVAVRKALGADPSQIRQQFLMETLLVGLMALLIAFCAVELALPFIQQWGGVALEMNYSGNWKTLAASGLTVMLAATLAGLYPAAILARIDSSQVLNATRLPTGSRFSGLVRHILVVLQFTAVSAFLIVVDGLGTQVRHLETAGLGYSREKVLTSQSMITSALSDLEVTAIVEAWRKTPGVTVVSFGPSPGEHFLTFTIKLSSADNEALSRESYLFSVDEHFLDVYNIDLTNGRMIGPADKINRDEELSLGTRDQIVNVVINAKAVETFGFHSPSDALGKDLVLKKARLHIVGIVPDQRIAAPTVPVLPTIHYYGLEQRKFYPSLVRYEGVSEETMAARLRAIWRSKRSDLPLDFTPLSEALDYYYRHDRRLAKLFLVGASMSTLIGVLGLYGMAAFSTSSRRSEIGLRKAMGATRWSVVRLLLFQFLKPVLLANLVAWPVAFIVLDRWLKQFDDRVALSLWFFLAGSGISLAVAVLTVAGLAFTAAGTTPGKALRHE